MITIIMDAAREGVRIQLVEQNVASFAIVYSDGDLYAIAHRTSDFACAMNSFSRSLEVAALGFTHPAWKKPAVRNIPINIGG